MIFVQLGKFSNLGTFREKCAAEILIVSVIWTQRIEENLNELKQVGVRVED